MTAKQQQNIAPSSGLPELTEASMSPAADRGKSMRGRVMDAILERVETLRHSPLTNQEHETAVGIAEAARKAAREANRQS